jgi:hypothetical protein
LFSAFSQIGQPDKNGNLHPCNPNLLASYNRFTDAGPAIPITDFRQHLTRFKTRSTKQFK